MLDLARLNDGDTLIDIGCGDGRIVDAAVRRGCRGIGIDIDPKRIAECQDKLGEFRCEDVKSADLGDATVVSLYLGHDGAALLEPKIRSLRGGTKIVSADSRFPNWWPVAYTRFNGSEIYLYQIAARDDGIKP